MRAWSSHFPLTLRQVLGLVYLLGVALLAAALAGWLQDHLHVQFREALLGNGRFLAERLAEDSRLALIQRAPANVRLRAALTRDFPHVAGVAVLTHRREPLVAEGTLPVARAALPPLEGAAGARLIWEDDRYLVLVAPVRVVADAAEPDPFAVTDPATPAAPPDRPAPAEWLGAVVLTLSKSATDAAVRTTNQQMLAAIAAGATVVGVGLLAVLGWITRPLQRLAERMTDPDTPRLYTPAPVRGVREARAMAAAFNALLAAFAEVNRDLVASNTALERARHDLTGRVRKTTGDLMATLDQLEHQNIALRDAREQALAASRVKSEFLANMSHEIRTPMHGMLGFISVLAQADLPPAQAESARMLMTAAEHLVKVIDGILDFSKLEAGKVVLDRSPFSPRAAARAAVGLFAPAARAKGLTLELELDPALPARAIGDDQRLRQILANLVDNAIKFTARGGIQVRVDLASRGPHAATLRAAVRDTGIGIPPECQATIFTAFDQVEGAAPRQPGGTGLGLAICRQLATLMGGRITVDSRPGSGSTFQVELEVEVAEGEAETEGERLEPEPGLLQESPEPEPPPARLPPSRPKAERTDLGRATGARDSGDREPIRILVVDDNPVNRALARIVFADCAAEVDEAPDGRAALDACQHTRYDLILMDLRMPGMDGLEATRRLRRWADNPNRAVPIVGLTAAVLREDRDQLLQAGLSDCLHKPLNAETLAAVLAQWGLDRRQAER
ncbi:MAG: ATP-binding protein [Candidatus Competibacteraceae bacterium]